MWFTKRKFGAKLTETEKCRNCSGAAELEWRGGHDFGCGEDGKLTPKESCTDVRVGEAGKE